MPHCIIEYSENLDAEQLVATAHQAMIDTGLFHVEDIKTRALPFAHFKLEDDLSSFIHVTVKMLEGRTHEQQFNVSRTVSMALDTLGLTSNCATVDIVIMERDLYSKVVSSSEE